MLVRAAQATAHMARLCSTELRSVRTAVHAPCNGEAVDVSPGSSSFKVALSDALLVRTRLRAMGEYELGWVDAHLGPTQRVRPYLEVPWWSNTSRQDQQRELPKADLIQAFACTYISAAGCFTRKSTTKLLQCCVLVASPSCATPTAPLMSNTSSYVELYYGDFPSTYADHALQCVPA